jgi:hypothetical protein
MAKNFTHLGGLNAYEVLGIEPTATTDEIETAYRAAIRRQHSDTGGVTRLAQLVNDARDALVKDRASYDAWLRARPRVTEAEPDPEPAASASDSSRSTWAPADDVPDENVWDPWETVGPQTPPHTPPGPRNQPGRTPNAAGEGRTPPSAEERRIGLLAVLASVFFGPLGLWLGIRSYRRGGSAAALVAIVIGGMSVLFIVSLAIAIPLGLFSELSSTGSSANPTVMKQGQVAVKPGTRVVLDEGRSFAASDDHASLAGTESGLRLEPGTSYVALAEPAPERYDTCSALDYREPADKPIAWNRLTIGSMLCVRTTYSETTKSLITVVDRSGRSATLQIITWND